MNGMRAAENDPTLSSVKAGTCLSLWAHPWPMEAFATAGAVESCTSGRPRQDLEVNPPREG